MGGAILGVMGNGEVIKRPPGSSVAAYRITCHPCFGGYGGEGNQDANTVEDIEPDLQG